jgi:hypothetical protein
MVEEGRKWMHMICCMYAFQKLKREEWSTSANLGRRIKEEMMAYWFCMKVRGGGTIGKRGVNKCKRDWHGAATSHNREGRVDQKVGERREGCWADLGLARNVEMSTNGYTG